MNPLHSSQSARWGTPADIVERSRNTLGHIHLDPASEPMFNAVVRADTFYTEEENGLNQRWAGNVFCNPPGDKTGKLTKQFWQKLVTGYCSGDVRSAIWIAFSVEQLSTLQGVSTYCLLDFPFCIPRKRLRFNKHTGEAMTQPTHSNAIVWLPPRHSMLEAHLDYSGRAAGFLNNFRDLGKVVIP